MQSRLAYVVLQLALVLCLSLLLAALYRRSKRHPVLWYWALYWLAQVPSYVAVIFYIVPNAADPTSIPFATRVILLLSLSFQPVPIIAAAICLRWKAPGTRFTFGLWLASLAILGAFRVGTANTLSAHGSVVLGRDVLTTIALIAFAWELVRGWRPATGLGWSLTIAFCIGYGAHQVLQALAQFDIGPYATPGSATSNLVGSLLQLSTAFGIVLAVVEDSANVANQARESDRRFRSLMEAVQLCGFMLDTLGRITFINDYYLNLTGWNRAEVLGKDYFDLFVHESRREVQREIWARALNGENLALHVECVNRIRNGGERTVQWTNTVLRDPGGAALGTASLGLDVTQQRLIEEQYRQSQKMESIGRLAGGVAHDFNNHLTVINGYCDLILTRLRQDDPARHAISEVRNAGQRAADLTRQLLAFSRRQVLEPRAVSMEDVTRGLESMLRRLLREEIEMTTDLRAGSSLVFADRGQMEQVLTNLVVNARDAIEGPGKICIEVAIEEVAAADSNQQSEIKPGAYVVLAVSDTGHGMDAATVAAIFEPFFTTKAVDRGTGLGLSMVHGIVRQSGGWIRVFSEPGRGTTFKIYLPRLADASPTAAAPAVPPFAKGGKESVLVVEDRDEVRGLAVSILRDAGYSVVEASDGPSALELIAKGAPAIDLLVTDAVMPRMTGQELARKLREIRPTIRVLCISGYTPKPFADPTMAGTAAVYLPKPFTPDQLLQKVRWTLDQQAGSSSAA